MNRIWMLLRWGNERMAGRRSALHWCCRLLPGHLWRSGLGRLGHHKGWPLQLQLVRFGGVGVCRVHRRRFALFPCAGLHITSSPVLIDRVDHMARTLFLENALNALDGVSFIIEQMANAAEQIHIIGAVVAPATAAFHGFDL